MTRSRISLLLALVVAVPAAAAAASFFAVAPQPCFVQGAAAYRFSSGAGADYTIRVDNDAAQPDLRLQLVDDPAGADFVLIDDGAGTEACRDAAAIKSIRVDAEAGKPDMTLSLSKEAADGGYKIYVRSVNFTARDAAALFAVIWKNAHGREFVARR